MVDVTTHCVVVIGDFALVSVADYRDCLRNITVDQIFGRSVGLRGSEVGGA